MMKLAKMLFAGVLALVTPAAFAQQTPPAAETPKNTPPRLIVVISVDQFSADLFAEYRNRFTAGFKRLLNGAVFPAAFQSHAATETCPGHSTILTGMRPTHTGIIANSWTDLRTPRADKVVYCAEDESVPGSTSANYTVSDRHLLVPTLGERMKTANPQTRVVSVAGKDRAAVMMGGHKVDELWWWDGKKFASYAGRAEPQSVQKVNASVPSLIAAGQKPLDEPDYCAARDRAIPVGGGKTVGTGRFERAPGDARPLRASPEFDGLVFSLAGALIQEMKLGKGPTTDIISIGASATDYVGHTYGTQGSEMCLQLTALDETLGDFFDKLDALGIDYEVALTADHGGIDLPERARDEGITEAQRITPGFTTKAVSDMIAAQLKLEGQVLFGDSGSGDIWIDPKLTSAQRTAVLARALAIYRANPQVAAAFSRAEIEAAPAPAGPPETWSLIMRAKASYYAPHSGDIIVALKPRITPIADPVHGYVATHGSFWDYDRRVPLLFWRKNMVHFEQPMTVETVDIAPTLAGTIGFALGAPQVDGRCLDLDAGAGTTCP